ncbi:MAG: methyltransferase domain-containing protein [Bdellovibrionota bacterium]
MSGSELENFYRDDAYEGFGGKFSPDAHREYVGFVKGFLNSKSVLEIGSGNGAAAFALHSQAVQVIASDIFPETALNNFSGLNLPISVLELNATKNNLPDCSVENYSLNQVLEHIAEPEECFRHCFRTLKPGGKIVIVSPNLLSPLTNLQVIWNGSTRKWKIPFAFRNDGYAFPFGSTLLGSFFTLHKIIFSVLELHLFPQRRRPRFRSPSLKKPALSDSDAVFLTEPLTVRAMLLKAGFKIVSFQENRKTGSLAGSVWIVAEKPE